MLSSSDFLSNPQLDTLPGKVDENPTFHQCPNATHAEAQLVLLYPSVSPSFMRADIHIHLASGSRIRAELLRNAGLDIVAKAVEIDEARLKSQLLAAKQAPEKIALELAREKALALEADGYVIGADQVLDFNGTILSKPRDKDEAQAHLHALRGQAHQLHSAVCVVCDGKTVFSHVATVTLKMRVFSEDFLEAYLQRNWPRISSAVGGYMLEEEGSRLFREIDGDYFTVLGLPLLALLNFFADEGAISA